MAMVDLMRRVDAIYVATGGGDPSQSKDKENLDGFRLAKKELHKKLKAIREDIKIRDEMEQENPRSTPAIEKSQRIRVDIKKSRDIVNTMVAELEKDKKKKSKQRLPEEELRARAEQIELAWKHIEECEQLEKRRFTQQQKAASAKQSHDLFSKSRISKPAATSSSGMASSSNAFNAPSPAAANSVDYHPATHSDLPPFEYDQQVQLLKERDQKLDEGVEEISVGVKKLKHVAQEIGNELTLQTNMLNAIEVKVDNANQQLLTLNSKMKKTLKKVKSGDRFIVNFILLMVVLGIAAYIYTMVK